jgi:hypothetical protein
MSRGRLSKQKEQNVETGQPGQGVPRETEEFLQDEQRAR